MKKFSIFLMVLIFPVFSSFSVNPKEEALATEKQRTQANEAQRIKSEESQRKSPAPNQN